MDLLNQNFKSVLLNSKMRNLYRILKTKFACIQISTFRVRAYSRKSICFKVYGRVDLYDFMYLKCMQL